MAGHEKHTVFLGRLDHFVTVGIAQGHGLFTEDMLLMPGSGQHRLLVEVVGSRHQYRVHIRPGAQGIQIGLHVTAVLLGDGLPVFRVQDGHHPGTFLLVHDAAQLGAEVSHTHNGVTDGLHSM